MCIRDSIHTDAYSGYNAVSGVNNTFDRGLDYYGFNFGEYDYFEAVSIYDEHDYKHEGDFTLVYYIRKNEDNLDDLIKQIVQENNSCLLYTSFAILKLLYNSFNYGILNRLSNLFLCWMIKHCAIILYHIDI